MERATVTPRDRAAQRPAPDARRPTSGADAVLALQAAAGNHAVARALAGRTLARCAGPCTCGGACGKGDELLDDDDARPAPF